MTTTAIMAPIPFPAGGFIPPFSIHDTWIIIANYPRKEPPPPLAVSRNCLFLPLIQGNGWMDGSGRGYYTWKLRVETERRGI